MDELVSFETAKLAKEKGFDWACFWVYKNEKLYLHKAKKYSSNKHNHHKHLVRDLIKNSTMLNAKIPRYSAPTQTNLQRWLREEHELHVYANYREFAIDALDGYYFYLGKSIYQPLSGGLERSDTYEGALEAGLLHALQSME